MLTETLKTLFIRDLNNLRREIESYRSEKTIWVTEKGINNSGGNLCLHLIGNLNTYIGAEIGKSKYTRNRELEFSAKDIPRLELLNKIDETIITVESALSMLTDEDINAEYPILVFDTMTTTEFLLVHLATHLTYHLGQINYHRRLLDIN